MYDYVRVWSLPTSFSLEAANKTRVHAPPHARSQLTPGFPVGSHARSNMELGVSPKQQSINPRISKVQRAGPVAGISQQHRHRQQFRAPKLTTTQSILHQHMARLYQE